MMTRSDAASAEPSDVGLNLFCSPDREGFRVYVSPAHPAGKLKHCIDENGEAYPVLLDFEDLERRMKRAGLLYKHHVSTRGDVELAAVGPAANVLAHWLSTAFASGIRGDEL